MIKNLLIFFAALLVLSGTFAGYLEWLLAQTEPGMAQKKTPSPSSPPHPEARM